jgi:23S rRNA (pseudouridine1915-N3)-methyltransferase
MIYCVFAGPFKDRRLQQMAGEFHQRLERLWPVTLLELPEKPKEMLKWLVNKEGKGRLVSLDAGGESMDSPSFAKWVTQSSQDIFFFGWGADGPPESIRGLDMKKLSLSPMTYSHEIARVLLLEQLYRAGAILRGHPYPR